MRFEATSEAERDRLHAEVALAVREEQAKLVAAR